MSCIVILYVYYLYKYVGMPSQLTLCSLANYKFTITRQMLQHRGASLRMHADDISVTVKYII